MKHPVATIWSLWHRRRGTIRWMLEIETGHGLARAHLNDAPEPVGALVLGHGAGGGVGARDLMAVTEVALGQRFVVALVEQPYRVAGRRSPAPARQLDRAWVDVLARLRAGPLAELPLVVGGRSSGARVACRTAVETGAAGVLCLAFPLQPPRRANGSAPVSRQDELDAVPVPVLVVQGKGDPFGVPTSTSSREVVVVAGNHSLTSDLAGVGRAVGDWLGTLVESSIRSSTVSP
jgi:predicted alpha/beta-hydrolase family hydrolase